MVEQHMPFGKLDFEAKSELSIIRFSVESDDVCQDGYTETKGFDGNLNHSRVFIGSYLDLRGFSSSLPHILS